jgi:hypothetical protein
MTTIWALPDGEEKDLKLLGEPHLAGGLQAGEMRVLKAVTIPGAGSFRKSYSAPIYRRRDMEELDRRTGEEWSFSRKRCRGVLARKGSRTLGYIRRRVGNHLLCIPVFDPKGFASLGWKTAGYLPVGDGWVAVARRRVGYWIWLTLAALAVFGVSYLLFTQGPQVLLATFQELPQTLSDSWYRLLRGWGLI